jgi:hypothetical protein
VAWVYVAGAHAYLFARLAIVIRELDDASSMWSPTSAQDSLPAGGQPLPGGLVFLRQAPHDGFSDLFLQFFGSSIDRLCLAHRSGTAKGVVYVHVPGACWTVTCSGFVL